MKKIIPACQSELTFLFVSHLLTFRHLREIKSVQWKFDYQRKEKDWLSKERKREHWGRFDCQSTCTLSLSEKEISLFQKLQVLLDYRVLGNKSDTKLFFFAKQPCSPESSAPPSKPSHLCSHLFYIRWQFWPLLKNGLKLTVYLFSINVIVTDAVCS